MVKALHSDNPIGIIKWSIPAMVTKFNKIGGLKNLKPSQVCMPFRSWWKFVKPFGIVIVNLSVYYE